MIIWEIGSFGKPNVNELDLNDFSSGTYLIKVKTTNKEITKIIMLSK